MVHFPNSYKKENFHLTGLGPAHMTVEKFSRES
jgi:hypothetical protein